MVTLALIGLVGGLVTGVSPCVLPMLPIIFYAGTTQDPYATTEGDGGVAVAERTTLRSRLSVFVRPLKIIAGLITSFSLIALFGTTVLAALGLPDDLLLWIGLAVLVAVGLGLIVPSLGHLIEKPFYRLPKINNPDAGAFLFGMGLGTLYVPCAGPVLAAIVVAGATGTVGLETVVLTISFAVGAALPLLFFAAAGSRASERIRAFRERARAFRIVSGVLLIALAIALASGAPAAIQRALPNYTSGLEQRIADSDTVQGALAPLENDENRELSKCTPGAKELESCGAAPSLKGTGEWFNTPDNQPISLNELRGKVVLVDFFAYSCINCQRDAPHIKEWYDAYESDGFEVLGVHSPEFAFEKDTGNLRSAIKKEGITWPVVQDNMLSTWTNYRNRYWPAKYLIDADGTVRAIKFGEGDYTGTEQKIRALLKEADPSVDLPKAVEDGASDTAATDDKTPETYFGWSKTKNYDGQPKLATDKVGEYQLAPGQADDTYSLGGRWKVESQRAVAVEGAESRLSFSARKVFHVLAGEGTVTVTVDDGPSKTIKISGTPNLYEIYSAKDADRHTITLEYSKGIEAYTFSFG
jgi:cytochrome c biogenesis protein CcdA/thiol-disulfide isomerase/thioredoxin